MPTPIRVLLKFVPRKPFKCKREEVEKRFRLKVPPQKDPFPVGNWVIGFNFTSDGKTHHVLAKWTWSCSICTPQELVQWRTTTSLGKKYNEFFIDPVQDSKVKQWYKLTTRCILGMSSKNIRSDLSTTFAKTWRARNKPPFLFLPLRCSVDSVALVWPAPSYSVTQWLLKQLRDTSNSDAYSWTVGSVHHYARVNWKAYHHIKASGIRSTSSFQAVFIPAPLHSFSCKEKTVQQILSTNQIRWVRRGCLCQKQPLRTHRIWFVLRSLFLSPFKLSIHSDTVPNRPNSCPNGIVTSPPRTMEHILVKQFPDSLICLASSGSGAQPPAVLSFQTHHVLQKCKSLPSHSNLSIEGVGCHIAQWQHLMQPLRVTSNNEADSDNHPTRDGDNDYGSDCFHMAKTMGSKQRENKIE